MWAVRCAAVVDESASAFVAAWIRLRLREHAVRELHDRLGRVVDRDREHGVRTAAHLIALGGGVLVDLRQLREDLRRVPAPDTGFAGLVEGQGVRIDALRGIAVLHPVQARIRLALDHARRRSGGDGCLAAGHRGARRGVGLAFVGIAGGADPGCWSGADPATLLQRVRGLVEHEALVGRRLAIGEIDVSPVHEGASTDGLRRLLRAGILVHLHVAELHARGSLHRGAQLARQWRAAARRQVLRQRALAGREPTRRRLHLCAPPWFLPVAIERHAARVSRARAAR